MTHRTLTPVIGGFTFLEGPRWHDGRLWLSDFYTHQVIAVGPAGKVEEIATVPQQPSGLGWLPDGTQLVVSKRDLKLLRLAQGELIAHADLSPLTGRHATVMVADGQGSA